MRKALFPLLAVCGTLHTDTFGIHYSIHGSGKEIIVNANSSDDD
jgi:hypothetical protein